jgi:hypothetical protein
MRSFEIPGFQKHDGAEVEKNGVLQKLISKLPLMHNFNRKNIDVITQKK